ncbi:MAG: hypothetical protein HZB46_18820 [Solirubrobacterales bacterium]|nr:hypothetical protein [Solirubrobacterales bacterium]
MIRARALLAALAALALALPLAACGDSEQKNDYVAAVNRAQNDLAKRFNELQTRITPTSTPAQDRKTLTGYETAVRRAVTDLKAVDPPKGLDDLHRRFIGDIADYGTEVRRARERLSSGSPRDAIAAQQRLVAAVNRISTRINATISAINDKLRD